MSGMLTRGAVGEPVWLLPVRAPGSLRTERESAVDVRARAI